MTKNIKSLYEEYRAAEAATNAIDVEDEAKFDEMLDIECEKLDALVEAIMEGINGEVSEFDIRHLLTCEKYAASVENIIARLAA